jgi:phosphopantetheine adenylyltransferase
VAIAATKGYGAEVVLHGSIWDKANEKARELMEDFPEAEVVARTTLVTEVAAVAPVGAVLRGLRWN